MAQVPDKQGEKFRVGDPRCYLERGITRSIKGGKVTALDPTLQSEFTFFAATCRGFSSIDNRQYFWDRA